MTPSHFAPQTAITAIIERIRPLIDRGGPEPFEYAALDCLITQIYEEQATNRITEQDIEFLRSLFDRDLLKDSLQGRALEKPLGYAGDYQMIDSIYTYQVSDNDRCRKWDLYFQSQSAPTAVRNRKEYFKQTLTEILSRQEHPLELLNVACGPARDLAELYESIQSEKLNATCIDQDQQAISYAEEMTAKAAAQIEFVKCNAFKFRPVKQFDVIWSAGLFDYFNDRAFVLMLKRFLKWLDDDGEIIIGNFSEDNPSRPYMEVVGDWLLHHRDQAHLLELARKAGAGSSRVEMEPEGVNLFLRIKKTVEENLSRPDPAATDSTP